jgi:hypothetical protein
VVSLVCKHNLVSIQGFVFFFSESKTNYIFFQLPIRCQSR